MKRILIKAAGLTGKLVAGLLLVFLAAVCITGVSPIYDFAAPKPFEGPKIFNPYRNLQLPADWKRANFHTHTRVSGPLNECEYTPLQTLQALEKFDYDIVTFSNHNLLTEHPTDSALQVNVYEHGYNLFKFHKLVFGCSEVNHFDALVPLLPSQKQFQYDLLNGDCEILQMNHPFRTNGTSRRGMEEITGYRIIELDSGVSTDQEYWDWALSAGHYSFATASDDLHYPDRSWKIAVRCTFLQCPGVPTWENLKASLLDGCYYCMRVPDYGKGDWDEKYRRNKDLPAVTNIGMKDSCTVFICLDRQADSIRVTGQDGRTLLLAENCAEASYEMAPADPYARFTAFFEGGEIIYSNAFARFDPAVSPTPYIYEPHGVNILLTVLWNLLMAALTGGCAFCMVRLFKKKKR